jgi:hypothetical protein
MNGGRVEDGDREWLEELGSGDPRIDRVATAFRYRAARWHSIGVRPYHLLTQWENDILTIAVDIDDSQRRCVVRTLRADYDGARVVVGVDGTGQLVTPLVDERHGVPVRSYNVRGETPEMIGSMMAERLEPEVVRPIVREEWDQIRFTRWVLADTGRELMWSSLTNQRLDRLGQAQRRIQVWGPFVLPAG